MEKEELDYTPASTVMRNCGVISFCQRVIAGNTGCMCKQEVRRGKLDSNVPYKLGQWSKK